MSKLKSELIIENKKLNNQKIDIFKKCQDLRIEINKLRNEIAESDKEWKKREHIDKEWKKREHILRNVISAMSEKIDRLEG